MSSIKGGKRLHGPDKHQDALRDVRSGAYDKGGPLDGRVTGRTRTCW
jgi:hypothetical protein